MLNNIELFKGTDRNRDKAVCSDDSRKCQSKQVTVTRSERVPIKYGKENAESMEMITQCGGVPADSKVFELQDEKFESFSSAPFEFETTVSDLWDDTQKVYYHACTANRFSDKYLVYCNQLEKNIKQLGSFCLTKAVLEQKGTELPKLKGLTIHELVCMVSYHYRKAHAALNGIYKENDTLGMTYLNWEFRWVGLGTRLKATEVKIQKIKAGKLNVESILEQTETFRNTPRSGQTASGSARSLNVNPKALPVKGSYAREMMRRETAEQKEKDRFLAEESRRLKALMGRRNSAPAFGLPPAFESAPAFGPLKDAPQPKPPSPVEPPKPVEKRSEPGMITEGEARRILIEESIKKGDHDAVMAIQQEDSAAFHERWNRHIEEIRAEKARQEAAARGPSLEIRKALREKRKKRK